MDIETQVGKNFAWLSTAQIGIRILGAAFFFLLSYLLKDVGLGQYSFVASLVPFWFIVVDFGAGGYLYREWTRGNNDVRAMDRDFNILFTTRLIILSLLFVPFVVVNYLSNRDVLGSLILFFIALFVSQIVNLYDLYLQSANRFNLVAIRQIVEKIIVTAIATTVLLFLPKVPVVFFAILVSYVGVLAYYRRYANLPFRLRLVFDWQRSKELFKRGMPFVLLGMFAAIYGRIDMIMLRYLSGFESVGWYSAAYKFLDLVSVFPGLLLTSVFPSISAAFADDGVDGQFDHLFARMFRVLFSFGILVSIGFVFFSPIIISIFFAESFGPAALALRILMIGQLFASLSLLFSNLLIVQRKEYAGLYIIIACAMLNVLLNFVLIPRYSLYGAAWATVIAEAVNLVLLQRYVQWHRSWIMLRIVFLFAIGNVALLILVNSYVLLDNLLIGVSVCAINVALLFATGLLRRDDIRLFLSPFISKFKSVTQRTIATETV